jgi:eukaryotic-like serine/threonine-protein kinase
MPRGLEHLLIGRALGGRYLPEEVLGRGGMSVVFRARDQTLGRPVALKLIQQPHGSDELRGVLRRRFRREAGSAARIPPHPNVVRVYDFGTDPDLDLDFIVMELLEGRDLGAALKRDPPPRDAAIRILLQAACGIAAGHAAGVVHRDIKPGNIFLVAGEGQVRVLDFGIAKMLEAGAEEELTVFGQTPHSPAYASPEQLDPEAPLTAAADVYQLGLVGYELLSGSRPYTAAERETLRHNRIPLPVRGSWNTVPETLRRVIERALRPDPHERYPDAKAFAQEWERAAAEFAHLMDPAALQTVSTDDRTGFATGADDATLAASLALDGDDATIAGDPTSGVPKETLFAPAGPDPIGAQGPPEATGVRRSATDALRRVASPVRGPGSRIRTLGALLLLSGLLWAATLVLGRRTVENSAMGEFDANFHDLQSEASQRLERAGTWER